MCDVNMISMQNMSVVFSTYAKYSIHLEKKHIIILCTLHGSFPWLGSLVQKQTPSLRFGQLPHECLVHSKAVTSLVANTCGKVVDAGQNTVLSMNLGDHNDVWGRLQKSMHLNSKNFHKTDNCLS